MWCLVPLSFPTFSHNVINAALSSKITVGLTCANKYNFYLQGRILTKQLLWWYIYSTKAHDSASVIDKVIILIIKLLTIIAPADPPRNIIKSNWA